MPGPRPTTWWPSCSPPGSPGTFRSAQAAVKAAGLEHIHLVDSATASLGIGLLALRAAELAEAGWPAEAIVEEVQRVRRQSGVFVTVDKFDNLLRSGRVTRGRAWLAGMLDLRPVLSMSERPDRTDRPDSGTRQPDPAGSGAAGAPADAAARKVRFGIAHAEAPEAAERLRTALWRPTSRATASSPSRPAFWEPTSAWAPGHYFTRWRREPPKPGSGIAVRSALPTAVRLAIDAIEDLKGQRLVVLDLRGLNDATDFFVIASGTSDTHVRGIANSVMEKLGPGRRASPPRRRRHHRSVGSA